MTCKTRNEENSLQFDREKRNGLKKKWSKKEMVYERNCQLKKILAKKWSKKELI